MRRRLMMVMAATVLVLAACGGSDDDGDATGTVDDTTTTSAGDTTTTDDETTSTDEDTTSSETTTTIDDETTTTTEASTTTSEPATLSQPALWPAADVVFDDPVDAAEDFVDTILGVEPVVGEFMQGDSRSGEIEVLFPGEGNGRAPLTRSLLLLRQLGPSDGWFVIGAVSDVQTIDSPSALDEVPAGVVTVSGSGRGFEGTVIVQAHIAGQTTGPIDEVVTNGGSFADPEPFEVELDLSAADPGETVTILVKGGVGLATDTGDFSAIPVVIS